MHYHNVMGTIHRLGRVRIVVYAGDHAPPHFHIQGPGFAVAVDLETLGILASSPQTRDHEEALRWAAANRNAIRDAWNRLNGEGHEG
ncbi:DUF4160 domain-containing protein [Desulfolutivibrio sp.]|uniref:DUF4160 domain-containing protein n=1 Tax=Desulfolutivibrio sp. TaxID=2773296 RepID=UPI002F964965